MALSQRFVTRFFVLTTILGILHHADHVLRYDHSGWPFRADVTPFTYSLLVYPLIAVLFLSRSRPLRMAVSISIALALLLAHTLLERPADQYAVWAHDRSRFPGAAGHPNLLHVASPALGVVAVVLALLLDAAVVALPFVIWNAADTERRESPA
jgi:hypothetical protein